MTLELAIATQQQIQEQRFLLSGGTWEQYETLRDLFDDRPRLKMFYLEGKLELFIPPEDHEEIKTILARLLELYAIESVGLYGYGSATYRKPSEERGLEPDECYYVGSKKQFPDIEIEVVMTSGLLDRLAIYQGLGVGEVWVWQDGQLFIQRLRESGYEQISRSEFLPDLDLDLLVRCALIPDQHDAAIAFRDALRS